MCGIAGIINPEISEAAHSIRSTVTEMIRLMHHRGPDEQRVDVMPGACLGHARLSIIDLQHGRQPMHSACGRFVLVFNGEIYNYLELRVELQRKGEALATYSDTEVLLRMLIKYGVDALRKLNGMFAFCFYDRQSNEWIIARDHMGIKPLYWSLNDVGVVFASEIKAILATRKNVPEVNFESLHEYFAFQFGLADKTMFKEVFKLLPGHYLTGKATQVNTAECFWKPSFRSDEQHTQDYFLEKLQYLLNDAIKLQVRSDVSLGGYLSGGLDSSTVIALASEKLVQPMNVFTGRFNESELFDESHYARLVSQHSDCCYNEVTANMNEFIDNFRFIIRMMDEPTAGPGVFPQFMVSKAASSKVKVILGGQGGDEIFVGYTRYFIAMLEHALKQGIDGKARGQKALEAMLTNLPILKSYQPLMQQFWRDGLFQAPEKRYFRLINRSPDTQSILTEEQLAAIDGRALFSKFQSMFLGVDSDDLGNQMLNFDRLTLLPALLHVEDRASMAASIESRVPLLDHRIVELMASVPMSMKFAGGSPKSMLKNAVSSMLPKAIINRQDKMGFPVPLNLWMKQPEFKSFVDSILLSQASLQRGIFTPTALQNASSLQGVGARQFWGMLCLETWFQEFIDA